MKKYLRFRWILLTMAALAIIGLTGMNVYSLYALHESTISAAADRQKAQLSDFSFTTRSRFRAPVAGIWKLNMEQLHDEFDQRLPLNTSLADVLFDATEDPLFGTVYFAYPDFDNCSTQGAIQRFDPTTRKLTTAGDVPDFICDGLGLTRTRMKVLLQDYRWSTKVVFDTHRTMTVALINPRGTEIVGYLTFEINNDYLINDYLSNQLVEAFGTGDQSGMSVWLHDWLKNEVLATNTPNVPYQRRKVQYIQRFPDLLDNWNLKVVFDESPAVIASKANLTRNLLVMGGALTLLLGSLTLMLILAQKERSLLERQAGFLANVTHELKTPLAMMQAAGENLADGRVTNPDRLKTYGKHIHTESLRLRHMIEKLLDVARNDAGQHIIKPKPYSLGVLVQNYMNEHQPLIKSSGFDPVIVIPDNLPLVMVDKDSFETILGNLVEDAMKYSIDEKYLAVRLIHDSQSISLQVEDHGLGIPKKSMKYIFDKFYRAEDTLTARTKGHGLGLSIVKSLVELSGATITVESTYRKGSVFSVTFPIHVASSKKQPQMVNPKAKIEYAS
ncbi:MAG: HAMP domain-containing histidine kinase [Balneolales bacterium]|nr:HAMP domain-containing histidine kinase [Balneolales bacterium]